MSKQHFQDNYINLEDELLGDLDRIRLKLHEDTQGMTPSEEVEYYQKKLRQSERVAAEKVVAK